MIAELSRGLWARVAFGGVLLIFHTERSGRLLVVQFGKQKISLKILYLNVNQFDIRSLILPFDF